ncbi:SRPBCC family protein [Bacillus sp. Gen3]|uniref:SRPBCC family protein n=1 Tax=Heyndrickxia oleronia TaxID=38875 RepID=UPI0015D1784B|nr:SRPBCC domain-containing protein [Bacillus sp. Gen3]
MNNITKDRQLTHEVSIDAPLDLVWHAWTISSRVSEWFAPETVIEPEIGGAYELYFVPGNKEGMNTKGCKVLHLAHQKELHFSWKGPDQFNEVMNNNELTVVKVSFQTIDEDKTSVKVIHDGFKDTNEWSEAFQWHQMAWVQVLNSLKAAIEKGEGELCCQLE